MGKTFGSGAGDVGSPREQAEAALGRLMRLNPPGRVSVAGAYALGYAALGMAQAERDEPEWFHELDPLDTLFLGAVFPQRLRDSYEFANARTAWLRLLRGTVHWKGIEGFVTEVVAASEQYEMAVDEGELMLLLAGRLEAARLDQRKIPRSLLPVTALAGCRVAQGPQPDVVLPTPPPPDAASRLAQLWAATGVDMPGDGSAADAMRVGLHLLGNLGLDVRGEPSLLLVALYAGLVACEDEEVGEFGERAMAWALGLAEDSPLLPVVDTLIVGAERGLGVDDLLRCAFGVAAFTESVRAQDRAWHSSPGQALVEIAFELGHSQVITRHGKVLRLGAGSVSLLRAQLARFEEKFGRAPGPDDPVFFDPDVDVPQPMRVSDIERHTVDMLEVAGISPAWIYACQHTGGLLPRPDGGFATEADRHEWDEAIARYLRLHPGTVVDHEEQARKLQTVPIVLALDMAARNPEYGASLVQRFTGPVTGEDTEVSQLRAYLRGNAATLVGKLRDDHVVAAAAGEYARAWAGAQLADRVASTAAGGPQVASILDEAVLLVAAVAALTSH